MAKISCDVLCAVVKESAHLQYPIELKAAGMENVSSNHADIVTKLALLRKYQYVVQNQTLPTFKFIPKIESFNYHWPNLRTRFCISEFSQGFLSELTIAEQPLKWMLLCWQFPRLLLQVPYSHWRIDLDVPSNFQYVSHVIDQSQNLLFCLYSYEGSSSKLYGVAFSLITGHPHDLAAPALGEIPIFESMPNEQRCIYPPTVTGESLFVLVKSRHDSEDSSEYYGPLSGNRISVIQFNWQTGKREMVRFCIKHGVWFKWSYWTLIGSFVHRMQLYNYLWSISKAQLTIVNITMRE
ncbi:hypothetical protein C8Q75DRAFT_150948 [Abortiporus biennis]|nr:hypothetical protein C8Q75DRAFT_150948 [Abortiporus biennis]